MGTGGDRYEETKQYDEGRLATHAGGLLSRPRARDYTPVTPPSRCFTTRVSASSSARRGRSAARRNGAPEEQEGEERPERDVDRSAKGRPKLRHARVRDQARVHHP